MAIHRVDVMRAKWGKKPTNLKYPTRTGVTRAPLRDDLEQRLKRVFNIDIYEHGVGQVKVIASIEDRR